MERKIITVTPSKDPALQVKRVCAYARVSSGKDAMLHSLSAQISYYQELIQKQPGWKFCGIYADEAMTGTKENRKKFQEMLEECRKGNIDLIITKSISRFARNTVTLLSTVRELKTLGVDVYFEEQNIHSMSGDGELMLTILASYAQEESLSASENQKWRVRANFKEGKPWNCKMLGYRYDGEKFVIHPAEAEIVRFVFRAYLDGMGRQLIANTLFEQGYKGRDGKPFSRGSVEKILRNYAYTGNLLLQKTYRENHLTKRGRKNDGVLPMYHATETHEAIIPLEMFTQVQEEMARRKEAFKSEGHLNRYPFSQLMVCGICGKHYVRKTCTKGYRWMCATYNNKGKKYCNSKMIPEDKLLEMTSDIDISQVDYIKVERENTIIIVFKDGTEITRQWQDRSRAESWTDEMRQKAAEHTRKRYQ